MTVAFLNLVYHLTSIVVSWHLCRHLGIVASDSKISRMSCTRILLKPRPLLVFLRGPQIPSANVLELASLVPGVRQVSLLRLLRLLRTLELFKLVGHRAYRAGICRATPGCIARAGYPRFMSQSFSERWAC